MRARSLITRLVIVGVALLVFATLERHGVIDGLSATGFDDGSDAVARAYAGRRSDVLVEGSGTVDRVLPDDTRGSRHQRFILRMGNGQTLLVAHNIDLAPRIRGLGKGDTVSFRGEYEWNDKGGVLHWTHHDPGGRHPGGWLEHEGQRYE